MQLEATNFVFEFFILFILLSMLLATAFFGPSFQTTRVSNLYFATAGNGRPDFTFLFLENQLDFLAISPYGPDN